MPLPIPNDNEKHDDFIQRCMSSPTMVKDYPDNKQRYAICENQSKSGLIELFGKLFNRLSYKNSHK